MIHNPPFLVIIDCNNICYMQHFGHRLDKTEDREVYDLTSIFLQKVLEYFNLFRPCVFAFCFDSKSQYRTNLHPQYKEKPTSTDDPLKKYTLDFTHDEMDRIRKVLTLMGFPNVFKVDGFESDDLIASIVKNNSGKFLPLVVSSDHDFWQLLDFCDIYNPVKKSFYRRDEFHAQYQILPCEWKMVMAISGCKGDNVPGIRGYGEKKALKEVRKGEYCENSTVPKAFEEQEAYVLWNLDLVSLPAPGTPDLLIQQSEFDPSIQHVLKRIPGSEDSLLHWELVLSNRKAWFK